MTDPVVTAAVSAILYSLLFYAKKVPKDEKTPFDPFKLLATIVVGIGVGLTFKFGGIPLNNVTLTEQLAAFTGIIALVEAVLKGLVRQFFPSVVPENGNGES